MRSHQPACTLDITMSGIGKNYPPTSLQPLRPKDFLDSRMYPVLIARNEHLKRASNKTIAARINGR
jgi:hypothetical protein